MDDTRLRRRGFLRLGAVTGLAALGVAAADTAVAGSGARTVTFRGTFAPLTAPDWHYLPVDVPDGVAAVDVAYSYTNPGLPLGDGVGNVIDIGIFDADGHGPGDAAGFRGWSGGARDSFSLSRGEATPGYLPGRIRPGRWHVVLGPVGIVDVVEWTVTVTLHPGGHGTRAVPAPPPPAVPGTGPGWYRGDLHTHTVHSDGRRTPEELLADARAAGLDFFVSTEHNTSSANRVWGHHVPADFLVVPGEEVTTRDGHWLAVGLPDDGWVDWRYRRRDGRLAEFTQQVRDAGGLAIAAHPYVPVPTTGWGFGDFDAVDALELWNGPWTADDQAGVELWHQRLVAGEFKPIVGTSDTHRPDQPPGTAQTVVYAETLSREAVVAGLRAGRSWLAESSSVDLQLEVDGPRATAGIGQTVDAGADDTVRVRLAVSGVPGCLATVRGAVAPLATAWADAAGRVSVVADVPAAASPFVRAEVRRPDGDVVVDPTTDIPLGTMVAMTNPVFIAV